MTISSASWNDNLAKQENAKRFAFFLIDKRLGLLSLTSPWFDFLEDMNQYEWILGSPKQFYILIQGALCINWEFVVSFYSHSVLILLNNAAWVVLFPEKTTPNWNVDSFYEIKIGLFDKRQNDKIKTLPTLDRSHSTLWKECDLPSVSHGLTFHGGQLTI